MKFLRFLFFIPLLLSLFSSCKKDKLLTDPSAKLDFSQDTVLFDTLFTTVGSTTKYFKVYNNNNQKILISNIRLAKGENSPYRFNADGLYGKSVNEIEINAHDSIFVFVEVTVDPTNMNNPLVIRDSLLFETNGKLQDVDLEAWGQDAYFHLPDNKIVFLTGGVLYYGFEPCSATWAADKPHVVYGYRVVDTLCTLTIDPGVNVFFHNNGGIWVRYGTIKVNGTYSQPVTFQGDRLEPEYQDVPGQWDRIWINEGSTQNVINYAVIKNGFIGIQPQVISNGSAPFKVSVTNTIVKNMSGWGMYAIYGNVEGYNNLFVNCGKNILALLDGGKYKFYHCTFANFYTKDQRSDAVLFMNNYDDVNGTLPFDTTTYFGNCIIYGSNAEEIAFDTAATTGAFNVLFEKCILKTTLNSNRFFNCYANASVSFKDPAGYDFKLNNNSAAKDSGKTSLGTAFPNDLDNKPRNIDTAPDIGAYEFQ
jgi:hypothetical protein